MKAGSKIYIAGPMRGCSLFNFQKFFFFAEWLEYSGYEVLNPAAADVERMFKSGWQFDESNYEEVLAFDLAWITAQADALFLLDGWEHSEGAKREKALAENLGLPWFEAKNAKIGSTIVLEEK